MNKKIYKYNDGNKDVYGDPIEIEYKINKALELEDSEVLFKWLLSGVDKTEQTKGETNLFMEAATRLAPAFAKGFDLKQLDKNTGEGLTILEIVNIYIEYMLWMMDVKKNTGQ